MKLIRFGEPGAEKPGVLLDDQTRLDASTFVSDYDEEFFGSGGLARLRQRLMNGHVSTRRRVSPQERLGPPIRRPSKIVCVGLNYRDHAAESGMQLPSEPVLFFKATSSLVGPNDALVIPRGAEKVDWEVELAVIIEKKASYVPREQASEFYRRLCSSQRLFRTKLPVGEGRSVDEGKERGHVRPSGAVSGNQR